MIDMKKIKILMGILLVVMLLAGCGKSENAQKADEMINSLGVITIDSRTQIEEAERAVDTLSEKEKESLEYYSTLLSAREKYDEIYAEQEALAEEKYNEVINSSRISVEDAYTMLADIRCENMNVISFREQLENLIECSGVFYEEGSYNATAEFYLQFGDVWAEVDSNLYGGAIYDGKVLGDDSNGFLFVEETGGVHINPFTNRLSEVEFYIRFGKEKMYIEWGASAYYLTRRE